MARTIVGNISATQENVTLSAALTAQPGDLFKIDNEVVSFGGYGSRGRLKDFTKTRVIFHRGQNETTAATHTNGAAVLGVAEALVAGSSEAEPSPFATAGQAANANLTAFSGLTLIADRLPYANGAGTLALTPFTAAGRALVDDADAAAMRTTLGLKRIIAGAVAADGTVLKGTGFTSARTDEGRFTVTFTAAFAAPPIVTIQPHSTGPDFSVIALLDASAPPLAASARVQIFDGTANYYDAAFEFTATEA